MPMRLKTIFLLLVMLTCNKFSFADDDNQNKSEPQLITTTLKKGTSTSNKLKPRAPSRQIVFLSYFDGHITLTFTVAEGDCTMYFTDNNSGKLETFYFDSTDLTVEFETLNTNNFTVEVVTESGNTYFGTSSDSY